VIYPAPRGGIDWIAGMIGDGYNSSGGLTMDWRHIAIRLEIEKLLCEKAQWDVNFARRIKKLLAIRSKKRSTPQPPRGKDVKRG